jgi:acyl-CoA synthetase (NDP forming)
MTVSAFFDRADQYTREYEDNDIPVYDSPEKAAHAISALVRYKTIQDRKPRKPPKDLKPDAAAVRLLDDAVKNHQSALDEYSAKRLLASYGIPVPKEILCHEADAAVAAAQTIGFPVVVKACDPEILHKTEQGLVYLNVSDTSGVSSAFHAIREAAGRTVPILIGEMIRGQREILAGVTFDAQFGHCVAFGMGGIFTEALNDVSYRMTPVSEGEADEMLEDVKSRKILSAYRGMPAVNRTSMARILSTLSRLPLIHDQIREIDINPIIFRGAEPVAVDALIVLKTPA